MTTSTLNGIKVMVPIKALSVNDAFRGRRFNTPEKAAFEKEVYFLLPKKKKIFGRIQIHFQFYLKNHASTDYDNLIKVFQDCLVNKGYMEDDRKIYWALIEKIPSDKNYILVEIKELLK